MAHLAIASMDMTPARNFFISEYSKETLSLSFPSNKFNEIQKNSSFVAFNIIKIPIDIDLKNVYSFDLYDYHTNVIISIPFEIIVLEATIFKTKKYTYIKIDNSIISNTLNGKFFLFNVLTLHDNINLIIRSEADFVFKIIYHCIHYNRDLMRTQIESTQTKIIHSYTHIKRNQLTNISPFPSISLPIFIYLIGDKCDGIFDYKMFIGNGNCINKAGKNYSVDVIHMDDDGSTSILITKGHGYVRVSNVLVLNNGMYSLLYS